MALVSSTEFNFWQTLKLGTSAGSGMKKLADNVHLGSYYRRGLGHHDVHNHDCVLCTDQAAHKKRGL